MLSNENKYSTLVYKINDSIVKWCPENAQEDKIFIYYKKANSKGYVRS